MKGRELEIFRNKFETEKERYRWLDDFSSGGSVLDVILIMTKVISRHTDVKIENLSIDDKEIHLDGSASSFKIVDSLKGKFSKTGCFENVKLVGARADKKQNLVEFNFVLVKKHEN
ncbi:MAG: PilN domain-containing protein [Deltaproteobacteria bacterium]|nr:PilN domain-containing protein [Deltaproteobacteria bacterium]